MRAELFIVLCCTLVLESSALNVEKRDQPSVLQLDLQKKSPQKYDGPLQRANKRQGTVETTDYNYQSQLLYIVELQVGTPPQQLFVQLDTGSSDLIVETPSSDICSTMPPNPCTDFGSCKNDSSILP